MQKIDSEDDGLEQRCPTHLPLATCGKWPFKCGKWPFKCGKWLNFQILKNYEVFAKKIGISNLIRHKSTLAVPGKISVLYGIT